MTDWTKLNLKIVKPTRVKGAPVYPDDVLEVDSEISKKEANMLLGYKMADAVDEKPSRAAKGKRGYSRRGKGAQASGGLSTASASGLVASDPI